MFDFRWGDYEVFSFRTRKGYGAMQVAIVELTPPFEHSSGAFMDYIKAAFPSGSPVTMRVIDSFIYWRDEGCDHRQRVRFCKLVLTKGAASPKRIATQAELLGSIQMHLQAQGYRDLEDLLKQAAQEQWTADDRDRAEQKLVRDTAHLARHYAKSASDVARATMNLEAVLQDLRTQLDALFAQEIIKARDNIADLRTAAMTAELDPLAVDLALEVVKGYLPPWFGEHPFILADVPNVDLPALYAKLAAREAAAADKEA